MGVNKIVYNNRTLVDLSGDTLVSADQLLKDIIAHAADGSRIIGTLESAGSEGIMSKSGTFTGVSGTEYTVTHDLGVVPKIVIVTIGVNSTYSATNSLKFAMAISSSVTPGEKGIGVNVSLNSRSTGSEVKEPMFDPDVGYDYTSDYTPFTTSASKPKESAAIWSTNASTFQINTSYYSYAALSSSLTYTWIVAA